MRALVHPNGRLILNGQIFHAALGKGGVRANKQEGDDATPVGLLPLRRILYRADRLSPPDCAVPVEPLAPTDGWCDDPTHPDYNRQIRLPSSSGSAPEPPHHEELWRSDHVYDLIGVLGWNDSPVQRGRGSAIFLHIARPDYAPTEGCIALSQPDLIRVLASGITEIEVLSS